MSNTHAVSTQHTSSRIASQPARSVGRRARPIGRTKGLSWLEIAILVVIAVALVYGVVASAPRAVVVTSQARVHVEQGDTLWSIAQTHPVEGQSTAQVAEAIARINELDGSHVAAGRYLMVPSAGGGEALASR